MEGPRLVTRGEDRLEVVRPLDAHLRAVARDTIGFMPEDEGLALYESALEAGRLGPMLEIGSYCGKSAIYLGAAAREMSTVLYSVDHHRGSEEQQPGQEYFDERLVDEEGNVDTLPTFVETILRAGLDDAVRPIVGYSTEVARGWNVPLSLVFIDGSHDEADALADLDAWSPHIVAGGRLAIHDVFEHPSEGGRGPFRAYERAVDSGRFEEVAREGSLRVLRKVDHGL